MKRLITVVAALLLAFTLAACGEEKAAVVKEKADTPGVVTESETAEPEDEIVEEPEPEQSESATANLGDLVTVGTWDVKVTKVALNAGSVIAAANQFNDKAKGQYVLVTYEATYTGSERSGSIDSDLTWSFTTTDSQVNDEAGQVTPADAAEWPYEARRGGTVRGQAVFDLPAGKIKGGTLTVEGYTADFDTVFADFTV